MKQKFQSVKIRHTLTNTGINAISESIHSGLAPVCNDSKTLTRLCLSAEEAMLGWQNRFGTEHECCLSISRRFHSFQIQLETEGERFDPTDDDHLSDYSHTLQTRLGLKPAFQYQRGINTLRYRWKGKEINPLALIVISALLAVIFGFLGTMLTPQTQEFISVQVLQRVQDTFFGLLSMVAMPLIFCSLITGICGMGDTATLSGTGMRLIKRYYFASLSAAFIAAVAMGLLLGLKVESNMGFVGNFMAFLDMIFGMIPSNMVGAFYDGSFTQIMILAIAIGIAMLILGQQTNHVIRFVEQVQRIFDLMMHWVCKILPIGVFCILVSNIWSNSGGQILQIWKPMMLAFFIQTAYMAGRLCVAGVQMKVSPLLLWKKLSPAFLVAFTSASSIAAYGEVLRCCNEELGIEKKMVDFGVPLGLGISSPGSSMAFMASTVYAMCLSGVSASPANFIMACVLCTLLLMSAPSTAGGPVSCFAIMFSHLVIPEYALGTTILVYLIQDFYCTGVNVTTKAVTLLEQAWKEEKVDPNILRN